MLVLVVLLGVFVCDALPPSIVWNQWIAQTFTGNPAYNSAPESREFALYLLAAHDGLNSVKGPGRRKYTPYVQYVDNNIHSFKSDEVIVAAAYRQMLKYTVTSRVTTDGTAYYFPITGPGNQSYYIDLIDNFYATFVAGLSPQPTNNQKARGEALGTAAANSVWQARAGDGFNRTIPQPYVPNFQPGKWYPRPNEAQIYPLKTYEIPISLPTPYYTLVQPPPFNLDDEDYLADLRYTKDKGSKGNTTRTAAESISAQFAVILAGARYQSAMLTALYPQLVSYAGYDLRDFTRLHALISMAQADSYTSVTNHKATYQFWRPWQAITRANEWAHIFPRFAELYDPTWQSFQTTPNNPEYPAGHPTASSCFSHTLRRVLGWEVFPGGSVTAIATPTIQESYTSVGEIEEKMINSRVFGGMHLRASGRVGVILGHRLVDYTVENWLLPVGAQNNNDGDDD